MKHHYSDITDKLGHPLWWDEEGVPRYCEFSHNQGANIYRDQICLMLIACQNCGQTFEVAMSQSEHGRMLAEAMRNIEIATLADQVSQKTIHYGDPPNYGCCPAGATMNSDPLRILQFWQRSKYDRDFKRVPELEIDLDPELIEELGI